MAALYKIKFWQESNSVLSEVEEQTKPYLHLCKTLGNLQEVISVANGGLFPAKWLILKIFGGQKKWLISHQNVAYFQPFKWLILSHRIAANCGLNVAYFCNLRQFCEIFLPAAANFKDHSYTVYQKTILFLHNLFNNI